MRRRRPKLVGRALLRRFFPNSIFTVFRFVVAASLLLLVTQQLLFLRSADVMPNPPSESLTHAGSAMSSPGNGWKGRLDRRLRKTLVWQDNEKRIEHVRPGWREDPEFQLLVSKGDQEIIAVQGHEKSNGRWWKVDSEDRKLSSSRAGQLARQLQELLTTARTYRELAEAHEDENLVKEIGKEISRSVMLLEGTGSEGGGFEDVSLQQVEERVKAMKQMVKKAREQPYDSTTLILRLRANLELAEKNAQAVNLQSKFYSQIAAKAVPSGLHCLSMRLTMEYNHNAKLQQLYNPPISKLHNKGLHHYALFSDNILAVAVVVNSTVQNLKKPWKHVFHIVTDRTTYAAMRAWFSINPPEGLTLEVKSLDEYPWINASYVPVLEQIETEAMKRFYFHSPANDGEVSNTEDITSLKYRNPKYLSILNHLRFYLPEMFPQLDKILFLDDDVVVQRDLSPLWEIPMHGKVNLAVETCGESFHRFWTYLNFSSPLLAGRFDPQGCGWAFGMNMFDLNRWRAGHYTQTYHYWQRQNVNRTLWKLGTLPAGLLTFDGATQALDRSWQVLGLGSSSNVSLEAIGNAAVIHFNGHAKPWLELAILKYQQFWARYVPYSHELLRSCHITPM